MIDFADTQRFAFRETAEGIGSAIVQWYATHASEP